MPSFLSWVLFKIQACEMMKLWFISKYFGIPEDTFFVTRHYFFSKYFVKKGINVSAISSASSFVKIKIKDFALRRNIKGFDYIVLKGPKIKMGANLKRVISWFIFEYRLNLATKKLKLEKPDIILVSSLSLLTALTAIRFKKKYGAKFIFEVRDIWPLSLVDIIGVSPKNPAVKFLAWVEKKAYENADYIIGTMPRLNLHIEQVIDKPFKFMHIGQGYDPEFMSNLKPLPNEIQEMIPKDKFIVGYAGGFNLAYKLEQFVDIAQYLKDKGQDHIVLVLMGDGPIKEKIVKLANSLDNIVFLPRVNKNQVVSFLRQCDILAHTLRDKKIYKYGISPNKWVDYLYSARPILVSCSCDTDVVSEVNCGEILPAEKPHILAEKIIEYSKKPKEELDEMGRRGKEYLIKYMNYDYLSDKYIKVFREVLGEATD